MKGKVVTEKEGFRATCYICSAWVWWRLENADKMVSELRRYGWKLYRGAWFCVPCARDQEEIIQEVHKMALPKRVGAISHRKDGVVFMFGYGVFLGELIPGDNPEIPIPAGAVASSRPDRRPNPCIQLDSGQYVWGCECWWGPEDQIKNMIERLECSTTDIDIDEERRKYRESLS